MTATVQVAARAATADDTERDAWAVLASANGLGPVGFGRILRRHGRATAVLEMALGPNGAGALIEAGLANVEQVLIDGDEIAKAPPRLDANVAAAIVQSARDGPRLLRRMRDLNVEVMTVDDRDYPPRLLALEMPPPVLFVRGASAALSAARPIAVVGTRRATEVGRRLALEIGEAISSVGGVVVSGLALGIDGAAHSGAVRAGQPTVAVIGSGHGHLYPRAHLRLANDIVATGGCIASELAPDVPGNRGTFPRRNRVISGLAEATVVVEAPNGSGALITADWALEQGRECFLVPGPIGAPTSAGCLAYLRAYAGQARIVATVPLLLEDLGFRIDVRPGARPSTLALGDTESRIAGLVAEGHATVDSLAAATGLPVSAVLSGLTLLEMRGLVAAAYGRYRPSGLLLPSVVPRRQAPLATGHSS